MDKRCYMDAIFSSLLVNDPKSFEVSVDEAMNNIAKKLSDVVNSYDPKDLPLLAAAMNVAAQSLKAVIGDTGTELSKLFEKKLAAIAVVNYKDGGKQ